jgi:8-oxo-dGTP pyrophosphatase MutT (NUDIX family)
MAAMSDPSCVGALIRDKENRVYIQRRSLARQQLPGAWDIVGGHVEHGETPEDALAREIGEETGWRLRRIEAVIADWTWSYNGVTQREVDYLVEVNGNLQEPRLEQGKHDKFCWVAYNALESVRTQYDAGNDALWTIIRRAARTRLTSVLRLEPIEAASAGALHRLIRNGVVALANFGVHDEEIPEVAESFDGLWDTGLGYNWVAYRREARQPVIGFGGIISSEINGAEQLVLQCSVSSGQQDLDSAVDIVKAVLTFTRNELRAERVFAYVQRSNPWARDVLARSGMVHCDTVQYGGRSAEAFVMRFVDDRSYDLAPEVVTGIGQIMAVPR